MNNRDLDAIRSQFTAYKALLEKPDGEISDEYLMRSLKQRILYANVKYLYAKYLFGVFCEVIAPFCGKRYGEKTRQKIMNIMHEKTGFYCFLDRSPYNFDIHFKSYHGDNLPIIHGEIVMWSKKPFLLNNIIQNGVTFEDLKIYGVYKFTPDPDKTAQQIISRIDKIQKLTKEYKELSTSFSEITPTSTITLPYVNFNIMYSDILQ